MSDALKSGPIVTAQSLFSLDGQVALITGASSGLGARFAEVLAAHGAKIAIAARRASRLQELAEKITHAGGQAVVVPLDIRNRDAIGPAFDEAERHFGPISILINNAGIGDDAEFPQGTAEAWDQMQRVNVDGPWFAGAEAARRMIAHGIRGTIINISSILGYRLIGSGSYHVAKAAVVHMTRAMAVGVAQQGIRVNGIAPGFIETEMTETFLNSDESRPMISRIPQRRFGQPSDLDGTILLLSSEKASGYMTGETIVVDGGHIWAFV